LRIVLFTGKGGVGKTTIAAATGVRAAGAGLRTLVMSTDPAHSLADALDVELGSEASEVAPGLWAEQVDAQARLEQNWREIQEYMVALLNWGGVEAIEAEELSVLPGLDEIFSLIDINRHEQSGEYDLLIVDCAPTAETLRLLSLPDALNWYIQRVFPSGRRLASVIRPVTKRVGSLPPIAEDRVFAAVERLYRNLERVRVLLSEPRTSTVRLVVNPEKMVIAEARRTFTYLALFGYRVDAVVVNRLLPDDVTDPYFKTWKRIQAKHFETVKEAFSPVPILTARLHRREIVGPKLLGEMAGEIYGDLDAAAVLYEDQPMSIQEEPDGFLLTLRLPFAQKGEVDVSRRGDEMFVRLGGHKRIFLLPHGLRRCEVKQASLCDGELEIRFVKPAREETGEPEREKRARSARRQKR
jgi:arsenite-transporting ATPase